MGTCLEFIGHRCRGAYCQRCGPSYWRKVSVKIEPYLYLFRHGRLLTLTIDPKRFNSPLAAYEAIEKNGLIKRLISRIKLKKAFKVMAFHENGWPHWHIVVDLSDLRGRKAKDCHGRTLRGQIRYMWNQLWGIGNIDLQLDFKRKYNSTLKSINYVISYAQHQSGTLPDWIQKMKRSPRFYEVYGDLRKAMQKNNDSKPRIWKEKSDQSTKKDRLESTIGQRLSKCSKSSIILQKQEFFDSAKYSYIDTIPYSPGQIALINKICPIPDIEVYEHSNGKSSEIRIKANCSSDQVELVINAIERAKRKLEKYVNVSDSGLSSEIADHMPENVEWIPDFLNGGWEAVTV